MQILPSLKMEFLKVESPTSVPSRLLPFNQVDRLCVSGTPFHFSLGSSCHESLTSVAFPSPPRQAEQRILSRVHSLERRLDALAAEFSSSWQKEAMRLERLELQQGAGRQGGGGGGLSHEDTLALLEGLVSRHEAALKEDLRRDTAARIQVGDRS